MRFIRTKQYQQIAKLDFKFFPFDYPIVDWDSSILWLLKEGDEYIGYCGIKPLNSTECYLIRSGLKPSFRGNGLQKSMINLRVKWAKNNDYSFIVTDTATHNFPSINNLIACRFKMFSPAYPWAGKSQLYWYKGLKR